MFKVQVTDIQYMYCTHVKKNKSLHFLDFTQTYALALVSLTERKNPAK